MGQDITLYNRNGEAKFSLSSRGTVSVVTKASQKQQLLADDTITIEITHARPLNITIGDYILVFGRCYTVNQLPEPSKTGNRVFATTLTLEGPQYELIDVHYHLPEDAYGDTYYANLKRHLDVLAWNIERIYPGRWVIVLNAEDYDEDYYQNITSSEKNCLEMLQELCDLFNVEYQVTSSPSVNTLQVLKKAGTTQPFTLQYGRGRGLYELKRTNVNNASITNRLYVYGGSDNLPQNYGYTKLCLPDTSRLTSFIEDEESIKAYGRKENEKNYSDIEPERIGEVTALGSDVITFIDESGSEDDPDKPPMFDLNETDSDGNTKWLIDSTSAKITFQTGNLAGYEFDLHSYDHATKKFIINKFTDENGLVIPNDTMGAFQLGIGDKYIITNIYLPDAYVKSAQKKLLAAALVDFPPLTQPQVSYKLTIAENFFTTLYGHEQTEILHVGDYIHIKDPDIGVDKEVRITAITRELTKAHSYDITLSDTVTKSTTVRILNEISDIQESISYNTGFSDPAVARRRWKATQELLNMVFDPEGDYYSEKIKPLSIETQMLSVGAKSTQFTLNNVTIQPNYGGDPNTILFSSGLLVHYGIDPDAPRTWQLASVSFSGLTATKPYYIYARCGRDTGGANFILNEVPLAYDVDASAYMFLVGVLNSVSTDDHGGNPARLISLTYGSTTINGRFVRCGRIESSGGGATYFDLDTGVICGQLRFISEDGNIKSVSDLEAKTSEIEDYVNNTINTTLAGLQDQLDGVIEQWFYAVDPADDTEPTSTWTTTADKEKHLGDLYYNTESGKVWRYVKVTVTSSTGKAHDVYQWNELADSDLAAALKLAQDALDMADDKARIFYVTPYAPYDPGDLWVQRSDGDIMVCNKARAEGSVPSFDASEWEKASKYTDDTALNDFINGQYSTDLLDLTDQIDGKIECFYTATNPASSWTTADYAAHVGDQWYNTGTKTLYRFSKTSRKTVIYDGTTRIGPYTDSSTGSIAIYYYWEKIENADAIAAAAAAATAQDTADGKRTVFVSQPTGPYYIGDLWLREWTSNGVDRKDLYRSIADRSTAGYYSANDWVVATFYDNTQTTIDGGIVTAGTVQLANGNSNSIVCGLTGGETEASDADEDTKVRIWAGASKENRFTAPFRVLQNGKVYSSDAEIEGTVKASSGTIGGWVIEKDQLTSAQEDDEGNAKDPVIVLDGEDGSITAAQSVVMDTNGFALRHDGYDKVKIANFSIGDYDKNLLLETLDRSNNPSYGTQDVTVYVPYSGSNYSYNPFKSLEVPLGFFEKGSIIEIGQCNYRFKIPYANSNDEHSVHLVINKPAIRISLLRDGEVVTREVNGEIVKKQWTSGAVEGSQGTTKNITVNPDETFIVGDGEEGAYTIKMECPGAWIWVVTPSSAILTTFTIDQYIRYKFTHHNIEHTLLARDGLLSQWKGGHLFLNKDAFIVKFGNYILRINSNGIQKSTDEGSTYTSL
jgi:hypothetical protein